MRFRVADTIDTLLSFKEEFDVGYGRYLEAELGVEVVQSGYNLFVNWRDFLTRCELPVFLDAITLIHRLAQRQQHNLNLRGYRERVERIFRETNVAYRLDEECGVHPFVDSAFEVSRSAAIAGLDAGRYAAAREHVERSDQAMLAVAPDYRQAIRSIFDTTETIFKLMFSRENQLNSRAIQNKLKPVIEARYSEGTTAMRAVNKQRDGFEDWINSAHNYRHAAGEQEPSQPPKELAELMVSQGFGWVRWLVEMDGYLVEMQRQI